MLIQPLLLLQDHGARRLQLVLKSDLLPLKLSDLNRGVLVLLDKLTSFVVVRIVLLVKLQLMMFSLTFKRL